MNWASETLEGLPYPQDYRATVDVYGSVLFAGGPRSEGHVSVWSPENPTGYRPGDQPSGSIWGPPERCVTVGISRSADPGPWSDISAIAAPFEAVAWGGIASSRTRILPWAFWGPAQRDGFRPIVLRSAHEPDAWFFAMSIPEFLVRVMTGSTGCPWLPPDPEPVALEIRTPPTPEDDPSISTDGWVRASRPPESGPDAESLLPLVDSVPLVVDTLAPTRIPGAGLRNRRREIAEPNSPSLDDLRIRFPPPSRPQDDGGWSEVEEILGAPLPPDFRELARLYGAGSFAASGGIPNDPPLHLLPAYLMASRALAAAEYWDAFDLNDLLGTDPIGDLRVVPFAVLGGETGELWLWRVRDDFGVAVLDETGENHVWPLPGSAADAVLDVLAQRGWFKLDELDPPPTHFIPSEYETNG